MIHTFTDFDETKCHYIQQKMKYAYYCEDAVSQEKINAKKLRLPKLKWYSNEKHARCPCTILKSFRQRALAVENIFKRHV